jgi:hypothetical protein
MPPSGFAQWSDAGTCSKGVSGGVGYGFIVSGDVGTSASCEPLSLSCGEGGAASIVPAISVDSAVGAMAIVPEEVVQSGRYWLNRAVLDVCGVAIVPEEVVDSVPGFCCLVVRARQDFFSFQLGSREAVANVLATSGTKTLGGASRNWREQAYSGSSPFSIASSTSSAQLKEGIFGLKSGKSVLFKFSDCSGNNWNNVLSGFRWKDAAHIKIKYANG